MSDLGRCTLVASNDRAVEKWGGNVEQVVMMEAYGEVPLKTRDLIRMSHKLLTHPQIPNLGPDQTPHRAILLYSEAGKSDTEDIRLIEEAIGAFNRWAVIKKMPKYDEEITYDYKTIDLSMTENVIPKL